MKKVHLVLVFVVIVLVTGYLVFPNHFPPRTPIKVVRIVSSLKVSSDIKFELLQDDWALNGDGTTHIKAKLTDKQLSELVRQAIDLGYLSLPFPTNFPGLNMPVGLADGDLGYYKLEVDKNDPRDYTLTIIDLGKREMIVFIWNM